MLPSIRPTRSSQTVWSDPLAIAPYNFDSLLDGLFNPSTRSSAQFDYPVDVYEDDTGFHVMAEMPGYGKDDVEITLENGILVVEADRHVEATPKGKQILHERRNHRYYRRFTLPAKIDDSKVGARLENGVLYLLLPKKDEAKPRRIRLK